MTEHFESDAHDYLLHQMDPARRAAFEAELERDPAARAALKTHADALAAFACTATSAEAMSASEQRATLTALAAATGSAVVSPTRERRTPVTWTRFLWPLAAAILLALNLIDFQRPLQPTTETRRAPPVATNAGSGTTPRLEPGAGANRGIDTTSGPQDQAPTASPPARDSVSAAAPGEVERLRANVAELERAQQRLRAEYDLLARRVAEQGRLNQELNRMSTMELVDAASYARGERKGLVNVGRGILTEPGIVVVNEPTTPPPGTATSQTGPKPYAWSVFDEQQRRGYLNLYHLPQVPADQSLQVWVRTADSPLPQPVGEVPRQYHGGAGNIQYALPDATSAPAEILITIEPRNAVRAAPMGPVILRGP